MSWRLGPFPDQDSDDENDLVQNNIFERMKTRWTDISAVDLMASSGWLEVKPRKVKKGDKSADGVSNVESGTDLSSSGSDNDLVDHKAKLVKNDAAAQRKQEDRKSKYIQAHQLMRRGASAKDQLTSTADALDATPGRIAAAGFTMMPHQLEGTGRLKASENSFLNAALLADDMGCGKTLQLIALMLSNPLPSPTLFVVPASLAAMWMKALTEKYVKPSMTLLYYHGQTKKTVTSNLLGNYEAVLTNYETLTREWLSCEECIHDFADRAKGKTHRVIDGEGGRQMIDLIDARISLPLIGMQWGRVVLDEGHRIRNEDTSIASAVYSLKALKRVVSTGTPFQNEYTDLRSIFVFLRIEPWNDRLFFKEHFLLTKRGKRSTSSKALLKGWRNNVLSLSLEGFWVRRLRGEQFQSCDVSNTIPTIRKVEWIELDDGQRYGRIGIDGCSEQGTQEACRLQWDKELQAEKEEAKKAGMPMDGDGMPTREVLQAVLRARMCCVHYSCPEGKYSEFGLEEAIDDAGDKNNGGDTTAGELLDVVLRRKKQSDASQNIKKTAALNRRNFREATKHRWHSTKIDKALDIIQERLTTDSGKLMVFCDYLTGLDILENTLDENNLPCLRDDGTMTATEKNSIWETFQSEQLPRIILLTNSCGSEGLDFTTATTIILLNPSWDPAQEMQCIARADPIGQLKTVTVYRLYCKVSIVVKIEEVQDEKLRKAERVIEPKRYITPKVRSEMLEWSLDDFINKVCSKAQMQTLKSL